MAGRNTNIAVVIPALMETTLFAADNIANRTDLIVSPPAQWPLERRQEYVEWSSEEVPGCRGHNARLEEIYDARVMEANTRLM